MKICTLALFVFFIASVSISAQSKSGIEGVWSLTEITYTGPNGSTQQMTQPSMYLFTKSHYSVIYVSSDKARPVINDVSKSSAAELRDVFVDSFIANAGTYEMKAGKLTLHPMVAKSPGYMATGTWATSSVKIDGNMMTLVSESTNSGPSTNPTTFKLKRIE